MPGMDAEKIVRDFCLAVPRRDAKELAGYFSDDAVYHNIPIAPVTGPAEIEKVLLQFLGPASEAEFEILALATNGNTVLTERVDRFRIGDKEIALPVMGTFEVDAQGRISAWRDYFDMNQFTSQMG
jgi:limonene-1,2-epoxide hydrolase